MKKKCKIRGCKRPYYAKGFCQLDYLSDRRRQKAAKKASKQTPVVMSSSRYVMTSYCCRKPVQEGEQHEMGKQYCTKCKEPCLWKYDYAV